MTISFTSMIDAFAQRKTQNRHPKLPTHDSMLLEHERRKGEELYRILHHDRRFLR